MRHAFLFVDGKLLCRFNPSDLRIQTRDLFLLQWYAQAMRGDQHGEHEQPQPQPPLQQAHDEQVIYLRVEERKATYWDPFVVWTRALTPDVTLVLLSALPPAEDGKASLPLAQQYTTASTFSTTSTTSTTSGGGSAYGSSSQYEPFVQCLTSTDLSSTAMIGFPMKLTLPQLSHFLSCKARSHVSILPLLASFPGLVHFVLERDGALTVPLAPASQLLRSTHHLSSSSSSSSQQQQQQQQQQQEHASSYVQQQEHAAYAAQEQRLHQQLMECLYQLRAMVHARPTADLVMAKSGSRRSSSSSSSRSNRSSGNQQQQWCYCHARLTVAVPVQLMNNGSAGISSSSTVATAAVVGMSTQADGGSGSGGDASKTVEVSVRLWTVWLGSTPFLSVEKLQKRLARRLLSMV